MTSPRITKFAVAFLPRKAANLGYRSVGGSSYTESSSSQYISLSDERMPSSHTQSYVFHNYILNSDEGLTERALMFFEKINKDDCLFLYGI
jgi:hypothetical protein